MDVLITTAWRAFWVGLGASAVLIVHGLVGNAPADASRRAPQEAAPVIVEDTRAESAFAPRPPSVYGRSKARVLDPS